MKYNYLISDQYCKSWTTIDAIREIISNAIDTNEEIDVHWQDGMGHVSNSESQLKIEHLLIGESSKAEDASVIGQFGEGLKIAALIITKQNKKFIVKSGDRIFTFLVEFNPEFNRNMLIVDVTTNPTLTKGTIVQFECLEEELNTAKNLFLKFAPVETYDNNLLNAPGDIYVLDVKVSENSETLFGYNFKNKILINRDRKILDQETVKKEIAHCLSSTKNEFVIKKYVEAAIEHNSSKLEMQVQFYSGHNSLWRDVIRKTYGEKVCVAVSNSEVNSRAKYLGYKVLDIESTPKYVITYAANIPYANDIAPEEIKEIVPIEQLSNEERRILKRVEYYASILLNAPSHNTFVSEALNENEAQQQGSDIFIGRKTLCNFGETFALFAHELAHIESKSIDCSHYFENMLTQYIGRIATKKLA